MAKVTSKLQVTVPKAVADRYGIKPGDEIRFEDAGEVIRVVPPHRHLRVPSRQMWRDVWRCSMPRPNGSADEKPSRSPRVSHHGVGLATICMTAAGRLAD